MRAVVLVLFGLGCLGVSARPARPMAPVPVVVAPRDKRPPTDVSTLRLEFSSGPWYGKFDDEFQRCDLDVTLRDKAGVIREVHELWAKSNQLFTVKELSFVVRFANGRTVEIPQSGPAEPEKAGYRLITIPAGGSIIDKSTVQECCTQGIEDFSKEFEKCNKFGVAVIIQSMRLASDYRGINGFEVPEKANPLADAEAYQVRKKLELEWKLFKEKLKEGGQP